MTKKEIELFVKEIDELNGDPEIDHSMADDILLRAVPIEISEAYYRLVNRSSFWACA